jgi:aspartate 1-decarboxylase
LPQITQNGNRLETYVTPGKKGEICMNGAAAHLMKPKDEIIIMAFSWTEKPISPKIILVDKNNNFLKNLTK